MWAMSSGAGAGNAVRGLGADARVVDIDDQQVAPVQPLGQSCGGDRGDRRGVLGHELDPGRRVRRVDRQIRRPGFEHRQYRYDRLGGTRKQQRHTLTRARTLAGQKVRQSVSDLVQLSVSHRTLTAHQRNRLGCARHLLGEGHRNRHRRRRLGQHRPVADLIQPGVFTGVEQLDRQQPPCRVSGHGLQYPLEPLDELFDTGRVEYVAVEFDTKTQFVARHGLHRQRVVGGFAAGELGDVQPVDA